MILAEILGPEGSVASRVKLDGTCVVGADRGCDLVLADPTVAPRHVELREGPGAAVGLKRLADHEEIRVGSLVVMSEAEVVLPATVNVGDVVLRLSVAPEEALDEPSPPRSREPGPPPPGRSCSR